MKKIPCPLPADDFKSHFSVFPWEHYVKAFHMIGNVYYIGDDFAASLLFATSEGLLLIDTGMPQCTPFLLHNIYQLGFQPSDIKKILHTHAHFDHTGATMCLKKLSDAKLYMSEIDVKMYFEHPELTTLGHVEMGWPLTQIDTELKDGDIVSLGETSVQCLVTPGHTDGALSFLVNIEENGQTYKAALFGGAGLNTLTTEYLMTNFGSLENRQKSLASLNRLEALEDISITLSNHPAMNNTFEKQKKKAFSSENPFLDPSEWKLFIQNMRNQFHKMIENEKKLII